MNRFLALFIIMVVIASISVAAWFMGAIIATVAIVLVSISIVVVLLWLSITSLWGTVSCSVKRLFKRKETK